MICFDNVSKHYGGRTKALSNISVEIKDGEFVFLIGPSGSGKTTFLRLLIRDLLPTSGNLVVDDWNVPELSVGKVHLLRRKIGTVFQDFKILTDRTIFENVAIGLEILGKKETEIKKDVGKILEVVGLGNKLDFFPLQLSAGELQRAGIARAIVGGPKILLADEPTGNLDPQNAHEIIEILQEINKLGTTVIMATHNVGLVNDLARRTLTLHEGQLVKDEPKGHYILPHRQKVNK